MDVSGDTTPDGGRAPSPGKGKVIPGGEIVPGDGLSFEGGVRVPNEPAGGQSNGQAGKTPEAPAPQPASR